MTRERVMYSLRARVAFKRGIDQMANLLAITLGPKARTVAVAPIVGNNKPPELLNDGATIARRVIELPDPFENMGAMLVRHLAWKVGETAGDGTTTAAVIMQAILHSATRYIAAGGNPMRMKRGLERALPVVLEELQRQARPVETEEDVTRVATVCSVNPEVGRFFGEIYDILGPEAVVIVQDSPGTKVEREYVEGFQWDKGYLSPYFVTDADRMEAVLDDALILVTDRFVTSMNQLIPIMEKVREASFSNLLLVAGDVQSDALSLLVTNKLHNSLNTLAVKAPGYGDRRIRILEDIAILSGGRPILEDAGDTLEEARIEDLGRAQRVWANRDFFSIVGGYGQPAAIRERIAHVKREIPTITDEYEREKARERLGKLAGGCAMMRVGAPTETERNELKLRIEDAVLSVRAAIEEGLVPGAGKALLNAVPAVEALSADDPDEAMGIRILAQALAAPVRRLARNSGYPPAAMVARVKAAPPTHGLDAVSGEIVDLWEAGIVDPVKVERILVETTVSAAMMALTTDVLVHRPQRHKYDFSANP
ncbi:MAG: molecular chaperone GroEL [Chloroflexi bacterium]|nr:molecular chaperone GroEL [Chloroflexota bacterium]